jgi:UDP-2,4-diacetamido-2,4,6-trideoxy-beta-L-altropyranose hydrolase
VNKKVVLRCDAADHIGAGHVMRCITLADALANHGWNCEFATRAATLETVPALSQSRHGIRLLTGDPKVEIAGLCEEMPEGCDLIVFDHYHRDIEDERTTRNWARRIMVIDDSPIRPHECDILLDQTFGRDEGSYRSLVPTKCKLLTGSKYILLRPQFAAAREARRIETNSRKKHFNVLVSLGYTDPLNLTERALEGIRLCGKPLTADVILGGSAPNLSQVRYFAEQMALNVKLHTDVQDVAGLMRKADLAIGGSGSSSWERCCLGLPTLTVVTAQNQVDVNNALMNAGAVRSLGWHQDFTPRRIGAAINEMANNQTALRKMQDLAFKICDGEGASRTSLAVNMIYH